jgi:hypothetical protein
MNGDHTPLANTVALVTGATSGIEATRAAAEGLRIRDRDGVAPQTLYGLADSPVALAAWMLDHDARSYEDISHAFAGHPVRDLTRDAVLANITLTWVTNTGVSSGRLYWETKLGFFDIKGVSIPAAVSVFPRELYQAPRSWAERAYPTSSTSTKSTRATTSRPGRSRTSSRARCGPRSGHCVDRGAWRRARTVRAAERHAVQRVRGARRPAADSGAWTIC